MYDVTSLTITGLHVIQRVSLYFSQCIVRTSVPLNQAFKYAYESQIHILQQEQKKEISWEQIVNIVNMHFFLKYLQFNTLEILYLYAEA